jgi:hypothetical protein
LLPARVILMRKPPPDASRAADALDHLAATGAVFAFLTIDLARSVALRADVFTGPRSAGRRLTRASAAIAFLAANY